MFPTLVKPNIVAIEASTGHEEARPRIPPLGLNVIRRPESDLTVGCHEAIFVSLFRDRV